MGEVIWDQSSRALQNKLESVNDYITMAENNDGNDYSPITIYQAKLTFLSQP